MNFSVKKTIPANPFTVYKKPAVPSHIVSKSRLTKPTTRIIPVTAIDFVRKTQIKPTVPSQPKVNKPIIAKIVPVLKKS